jgi:hypothetical protein
VVLEAKNWLLFNKRMSFLDKRQCFIVTFETCYIYVSLKFIIFEDLFDTKQFSYETWHVKHMEKTIIKFVTGLSLNASRWEKSQNKRYGRITNVCRRIEYDIKQGASNEQVLLLLQKIRNDSSFSNLQKDNGSMERLNELDKHFLPSKEEKSYVRY